jgi:amidophosphoribosyltransferase
MKQIKESCGIFGVFNSTEAAQHTYYGLHALQHRGQEASGIVTSTYDENKKRWMMPIHKDHGLVLDVFNDPSLFDSKLLGMSAIGHNRYSTSGSSNNSANIQPFKVHYRDGNLALAHNGNISNARELRNAFSERGTIFQTTSDSELILHLIAQSRRKRQIDQIIDALTQLEGAFSLLMLTDSSLIAVRDPNGFRPLVLGVLRRPADQGGDTFCVSSETCAFDLLGAEYVRDILPGEILVIDRQGCESGHFSSYQLPQKHGVSQCIFEYIYFARPDSKVFANSSPTRHPFHCLPPGRGHQSSSPCRTRPIRPHSAMSPSVRNSAIHASTR